MKKHSLRQIDLDRVDFFDGYDMTIVYMDGIACMQTVANFLAVVAGQYSGALAEAGADTGERITACGAQIEFASYQLTRDRHAWDAGIARDRAGR
jgi:hypothetical protein